MRDFMPLAQAQNRAVWKDFPHGVPAKFAAALDASADRSQCRYLEARRGRLEAAIAECSEHPGVCLNHRYFAKLRCGYVMSTTEAVTEVAAEIAYQKRRPTYCRDPQRIVDLKEALVFARYWRRFSRRVWARQAVAA